MRKILAIVEISIKNEKHAVFFKTYNSESSAVKNLFYERTFGSSFKEDDIVSTRINCIENFQMIIKA